MFPVTEHFISINGEGAHAGEIALFIRFRGCNLCCSYCDTRWSCRNDAPAEMMSADDLVRLAGDSGITNITLTGGEPLLQKELPELCSRLIHRPVFTADYKLPSSECEDKMLTENYRYFGKHDTVKFVAGSKRDLEKANEIIKEYDLIERCHVFISPVFGKLDPSEIVEFVKDNRLNGVRLQLQMHKFIWQPETRGV